MLIEQESPGLLNKPLAGNYDNIWSLDFMGKKDKKKEFNENLNEYNSAISLLDHHANLMWQENSVFLIAITVLLGFIGTALSEIDVDQITIQQKFIIVGGEGLGLILSLLWLAVFSYNYPYHKLRLFQARKLEKSLRFTLFEEGKEIYCGKTIQFGNDKVKINWIARKFSPGKSFAILIFLFIIMFGSLIIFSLVWL